MSVIHYIYFLKIGRVAVKCSSLNGAIFITKVMHGEQLHEAIHNVLLLWSQIARDHLHVQK